MSRDGLTELHLPGGVVLNRETLQRGLACVAEGRLGDASPEEIEAVKALIRASAMGMANDDLDVETRCALGALQDALDSAEIYDASIPVSSLLPCLCIELGREVGLEELRTLITLANNERSEELGKWSLVERDSATVVALDRPGRGRPITSDRTQ